MKSASHTQQMGRREQQPTLPNGLVFSLFPNLLINARRLGGDTWKCRRKVKKLMVEARAGLFEVWLGSSLIATHFGIKCRFKKKERKMLFFNWKKWLFLEIILQGLMEVHLWQEMFNIRCCLFKILSLWWDQSIQMIRTRPPKRPQSDEQTTGSRGKKKTHNLFIYFLSFIL